MNRPDIHKDLLKLKSRRCVMCVGASGLGFHSPFGVIPESVLVSDYYFLLLANVEMAISSVYEYCMTMSCSPGGGFMSGNVSGVSGLGASGQDTSNIFYGLINFLHEIANQTNMYTALPLETRALLQQMRTCLLPFLQKC